MTERQPNPWRDDLLLKCRAHPEFPDDFQAVFYDFETYLDDPFVEVMWVRLVRVVAPGAWEASLLNQPHKLRSVNAGDSAIVRLPRGTEHLVFLPREAVAERMRFGMSCQVCRFDMLFCSADALVKRQFGKERRAGAFQAVTTRCFACRQTMLVWRWDADPAIHDRLPPKPSDPLISPLYVDHL